MLILLFHSQEHHIVQIKDWIKYSAIIEVFNINNKPLVIKRDKRQQHKYKNVEYSNINQGGIHACLKNWCANKIDKTKYF